MAATSQVNVLLAGWSGNVGQKFLQQLCKRPDVQLFVLVRADSQRQDQLQAYKDKVTVVNADVLHDSVDKLADLLKQHHITTIVSCLGENPAELIPAGQSKLIDAAVQAKTVTLFLPSEYGYEYGAIGRDNLLPDIFGAKLDQRQKLEQLHQQHPHFNYVIVVPSTFTEYVIPVDFLGIDLKKRHIRAAGSLQTHLTMTCIDDVGRVVAQIAVERPADALNRVVLLAGDTLTYKELQQKLEHITNSKFTVEEVSAEELLKRQRAAEESKDKDKRLDAAYNGGVAGETGHTWPVADTWNHKHGIKLQTVDEWIEQHGVDGSK